MSSKGLKNIPLPFILVVILGLLLLNSQTALAANLTWDNDNADGLWSTCANWSTNACPGAGDIAIFDATSTANATIDAGFAGSVGGIRILAAYTGQVIQNKAITVGASGIIMSGGTFTGGAQNLDLNGSISISAGTFTAPSAQFSIERNFTISGTGTFNDNGGTVIFDGAIDSAVDVNVNETFNNLEINTSRDVNVDKGDILVINGALTLTNGEIYDGEFRVRGTVLHGAGFDGGDSWVNISVATTFTKDANGNIPGIRLTHNNASFDGSAGSLITQSIQGGIDIQNGTFIASSGPMIYRASGTVPTLFNINSGATFTHSNGTIKVESSKSEFTGDWTFFNLDLRHNTTNNIQFESGKTVTATNNLFMMGRTSVPPFVATIRSSISGSQANINYTNGYFGYLDVKDIKNNNGSVAKCATLCTDNGNNSNWEFGMPGVTVGSPSGNVMETGSTATFTVVLTKAPTANVSIPVSSSDSSEGTASPSTLTFTTSNWNTSQTVTVTGVDDSNNDGDVKFTIALGSITSSDTSYNGLNPADVTLINVDNDDEFGSSNLAVNFTSSSAVDLEDVKNTGVTAVAWFNENFRGRGNFEVINGGGADSDISGANSKIKAGCQVDLDGTTYTIVRIEDASTGLVHLTDDPGTAPTSFSTGDKKVNSITCTAVTERGVQLNDDSLIATNVTSQTVNSFAFYDSSQNKVLFSGDSSWYLRDPTSLTITGPIASSGLYTESRFAFDTNRNRLWHTVFDADLVRVLTPGTLTEINSYPVGDGPTDILYDRTSDAIWVANSNSASNNIMKLNPSTGAIITTLNLSDWFAGDSFSGVFGLASATSDNAIWVIHEDGRALTKINALTGTFYNGTEVNSTFFPPVPDKSNDNTYQIEFDGTTKTLWMFTDQCNGQNDYLIQIDASSGDTLAFVAVPSCPKQIAMDVDNRRAYVISQFYGTISELDLDSATIIENHYATETGDGIVIDSAGTFHVVNNDAGGNFIETYVKNGSPTGYYTSISNNNSQIDTTNISRIEQVAITENSDGANTYYALSFDGRNNFKVWGSWITIASNQSSVHGGVNGNWYYRQLNGTFTAASPSTAQAAISSAVALGGSNLMTKTQLEALGQNDFNLTGGWTQGNTIDVAITFNATSATQNPSLSKVVFRETAQDPPGFTISNISNDIQFQGDTATFTVALNSQPSSNVTTAISTSNSSKITTTPSSLTFTSDNWNTAQTVTVTRVDNPNSGPDEIATIITGAGRSLDSNYNDRDPSDINVTLKNNINTAPTVSAGGILHAVEGSRVRLVGTASDREQSSLSYEWYQVSGKEVSIDNATSLIATITLPYDNLEVIVLRLSVSDGTNTTTDDLIILPIKPRLSMKRDLSFNGQMLFSNTSKFVHADPNVTCPDGLTCTQVLLENGSYVFTNSINDTQVTSIGDYTILSDTSYDDGKGIIVVIRNSLFTGSHIDLTQVPFSSNHAGVIAFTPGPVEQGLYGLRLGTGDANASGVAEVFNYHLSDLHGEILLHDLNTLSEKYYLTGFQGWQISKEFRVANIDGAGGQDLIYATTPDAEGESDEITNVYAHLMTSSMSLNISPRNFSLMFDHDQATIQKFEIGDIDNDGLQDLFLFTDDGIYTYKGKESLTGSDRVTITEDFIFDHVESSTVTDVLIGDATGDGIADILIGYANANQGKGLIFILPGRNSITSDDVKLNYAFVIEGTSQFSVGLNMFLGDVDHDGISELFTGPTSEQIIGVELTQSYLTSLNPFANYSLEGACSLNSATNKVASIWIFVFMILPPIVFVRLKKWMESQR